MGLGPDVGDLETHFLLFEVGLAQNLDRPRDVEQQRARRRHHVDRI